ncbi:hypothetical protein [Stratiformator vulcanicus]|uniref:Uncharacterized protein n=1 Tax=Stratiformator vulcanicus TaxID=2527980 RepID=A0A517R277_9PLAN|nr:hypothetical protein [Stratiformator vulcanicus]QDT37961.1 hypothetical protein Pan189_23450 [Stratiformator vulcanicus]
MSKLFRNLMADESGIILSAELVLILTLGVLACVVGINAIAKAVNHELMDVASAISAVDQSYYVSGFYNSHGNAGKAGFGFVDRADECDCAAVVSGSCNVVDGAFRRGEAIQHPIAPNDAIQSPVPMLHDDVAPCLDCEEVIGPCHGCDIEPVPADEPVKH